MAAKYLSAANAAALDKDLIERFPTPTIHNVYKVHPPSKGRRILVACGPGNNGGDGLEKMNFINVSLPNYAIFQSHLLMIFPVLLKESDHIVDAIFGFSFSGTLRDPFPSIITALSESSLPITSIDAPSSWDITSGPPPSGPGSFLHAPTLDQSNSAQNLL
ncbi:hypothetical protein DID88_007344 [Monilinia fructigena]|uniref:NAD(P)H-hydrate epimerase n=1 Tax=Monilinia fructigena TaxID=38457 RepID=A0A395J8G5_9HELO|nr:hypothetical protein DID88_007344 [Monilinia fructigena]